MRQFLRTPKDKFRKIKMINNNISIYKRLLNKARWNICNKGCALLIAVTIAVLSLFGVSPVFADNTVKLKVLVITTGDETQDMGLAYIKPVLDEMGVPFDVLNAATQDLTATMLASSSGIACSAAETGCAGNYNGIILTNSDLASNFSPSEWELLFAYQKDFHVRQAVLSGWPGTYWDPNPPFGIYLDYGLSYSSGGTSYTGEWTVPVADKKVVFEYINQANALAITDFAFAAIPRNDGTLARDGTEAKVVPLLTTQAGETLLSVIRYMMPNETTPVREVMLSTITHASFLIHSQVLAYEFVNWVTQGVFVGARHVYMSAHLDDLFLPNELWDIELQGTNPLHTYRLNSDDINNVVSKQADFRATHPTAGNTFKLDFAFNGAGAVINPEEKRNALLVPDLLDDLVLAVVANKDEFRFINHTYTHADMDKAPTPANSTCDYSTSSTVAAIKAEIGKNRTVWGLLGLPEKSNNNRVLVTGNHSGLKDRKCTDIPENHPGIDVQADDVHFPDGANPLFFQAAAQSNVKYLASDSSQPNQAVERYVSEVNDGSTTDRLILPRWPANVFYNVINPEQLVDEYNYIFHDRFVNAGEDPCSIPGAICAARDYPEILSAEADTALRHMMTFKKWPHFFHQTNVAKYDAEGNTLQFDWLGSVYAEYEKIFTLPVKNYPYYLIGDMTRDRLIAKSAVIDATWNRTTNKVTLSANMNVPKLQVTGVGGGESYGGQFIREIYVTTTPKTFNVNQALNQ